MKIVYHVGVHCSDDDQILKCLLQNTVRLAEAGILVPEPARYRQLLRKTMKSIQDGFIAPDVESDLIEEILDEPDAYRVVLSHYAFFGVVAHALGQNQFYPMATSRAPQLRNLFPRSEIEFCIAIRNPATFIPSAFERSNQDDFFKYMSGADPMQLKWSELILRLRQSVPEAPVTVWCNEDTPLIWPKVLQKVSGHDPKSQLVGQDDFLAALMSRGGFARMKAYLKLHKPKSEAQRRRVVMAFLDKFAKPDALEQEIDLPGWTEDYVTTLSDLYDQDLDLIATLPGVDLITP